MNAAEMVVRMQRAGFNLGVKDDALTITPASRLTDPQRQWIRDHKAEILAALTPANDGPLMVRCWTPAGDPVDMQAKDADHAAWLRRMNPAPKP